MPAVIVGADGPFAGIAPDPRHELREIDEFVCLPAQFVGDHRRLRRDRRDDRDPHALALDQLDERAEVAVAREKHHEVEVVGHLHRVDRELDVHVAL